MGAELGNRLGGGIKNRQMFSGEKAPVLSLMKCLCLVFALSHTASSHAACVILLHGLLRSPGAMEHMASRLSDVGYTSVNLGYPSRRYPVAELADIAIEPALKACSADQPIHFVTHSLGGILVRHYLNERRIENLGRVVMLGPPNQGSEVVDKLGHFPGFHWLNGDAGLQLGTGPSSVPNTLGRAHFDVGIIAGTRSINWILSMLIPGSDDGKVSVERTRLEGMNDHIVMAASHAFIMKDDEVIDQVLHYLKHGRFDHDDERDDS